MIALISKPAGTERFNTETKSDPLILRELQFEALGQRFCVELHVPAYIDGKLLEEDWDIVDKLVTEYAENLRRSAAMNGSLFDPLARSQMGEHVSAYARKAVYNQFMKYQVRAGNHEGHEVPESLQ